MSDDIAEYFKLAVRAQALAHTGQHFCAEHLESCKDMETKCSDCPLKTPAQGETR